jgi:peptidoglycan/LPS O-acetylase OafA/YrhL
MDKRFLGSTISLGFGVLMILSAVNAFNKIPPADRVPFSEVPDPFLSMFNAGVSVLLCALAYRSAKRRYLGNVTSSALRYGLEWFAVLLVLGLVLGRSDLNSAIAHDPTPSLLIPAWAVIAYLTMTFRSPCESTSQDDPPK